jgi:hypothetical protein
MEVQAQPLKSRKSSKGFLYKTHTIRNKFTNPQILYPVKKLDDELQEEYDTIQNVSFNKYKSDT